MIILLQIYKTFPIFIEIDKEMWLFYIKKDAIVNNSSRIFIESFKFTSKYKGTNGMSRECPLRARYLYYI